ncbi:hypothetical protein O9992_11880 [Vibrio lentus]|nr:hypothetical protein [Vibrio lentus]
MPFLAQPENFGAGMTGGFAYVMDKNEDFQGRVNNESVEALSLSDSFIHPGTIYAA